MHTVGDSFAMARTLDSLLVNTGFKLSPELFNVLSGMNTYDCGKLSRNILKSVKELVGGHVEHNVYFKRFPDSVPDTYEFWADCVVDALSNSESAKNVIVSLSFGRINLLDLPKYGNYLHTYEDMVAVHEAFTGCTCDKTKVLQLGGTLLREGNMLYESLAGSRIPLSENDRGLLIKLAGLYVDYNQPTIIPMKENRALINSVRINAGRPIIVDTITDILRVACELSGGDVTLATKTRFKSLPRMQRRLLLFALNNIADIAPEKLADVNVYSEEWKRLFERLHPWEYKRGYPGACAVHETAMQIRKIRSITSRIETTLNNGDIKDAINLYKNAPGMLYRNLDRLLRNYELFEELVVEAVSDTAKKVPARLLFSVREHLQNRIKKAESNRIFTNSKGRTWVENDTRKPLKKAVVDKVFDIIDNELVLRLPDMPRVIISPEMLNVAIPKSSKDMENGFCVMPRGSKIPVCMNGEKLRFFIYWKQHEQTTDFDLSTLLLDKDFVETGYASYTNIKGEGYVHSGDITSAPNGASEFVEIDLSIVDANYIVPQVNIYSGENFNEVDESFFGFMERDPKQKGLPYEPASVRNKSDIRGVGRVSLPMVFGKQEDGSWQAFWMQMYLKGMPHFNCVEDNRCNTTMLAKSVVNREYLYISYIAELLKRRNIEVSNSIDGIDEPVVYIGLTAPEKLPEGSTLFTLANIHEIVNMFDTISE
jgi:stress response protein SCP2